MDAASFLDDALKFLDGRSAAIVVGGTLLATLLRCGFTDCRRALAGIFGIGRRRFDAQRAQSELAVQVREIRQDGLLRASPHHTGDSEFDQLTDALIGSRSVSGLLEAHEAHKARRQEADNRAVRTLAQAAELAPVFGLAGTLVSLTKLPVDGLAKGGAYGEAISMAVLSTLYGLLLANFLLAPLSRAVERAAAGEEGERQKIIDWLARQLAAPATSAPAASGRRKPALAEVASA
jgi:chemotaxis protein MotA